MVDQLFQELAALPQVEAIALGGSRAGTAFDAASDYDVYLYCTGPIPESERSRILSRFCSVMELGNHFWEHEDNCTLNSGVDLDLLYRDLDAFCRDEHFAEFLPEYANLDELKAHYQRGGLGDVKVKKLLNNVLQEELAPIRAARQQWQKDIPGVYEILKKGSQVARAEAAQTLDQVKRAMRINYFEDGALIQSHVERYK